MPRTKKHDKLRRPTISKNIRMWRAYWHQKPNTSMLPLSANTFQRNLNHTLYTPTIYKINTFPTPTNLQNNHCHIEFDSSQLYYKAPLQF